MKPLATKQARKGTGVATIETVEALENELQRLLIEFVNTTGRAIDHVHIDCRQFANLAVEVFLAEEKK
jgi:hypothetical protein